MIGLEIHCQLTRLQSKLFCPCRADYRGMEPNTNVCPVCMGLPGTLPRLNAAAVRSAAAISLSLNCTPAPRLAFFRKNYFYPDLPKNFQITQYDAYGHTSIGGSGVVRLGEKDIRITRVQLEEDPGRLSYEGGADGRATTLVDYNRAGVPLVEIVTEPDFDAPRQARDFMNMLADMVESLGVADTRLDGAMRADGNVSVRGGNKVETKNINSFHDLEKALRFELARQNSMCDAGREVVQETRHWDERRRITVSSRAKEAELDYRYFLEGDIPWIVMDDQTINDIRNTMPESASSRQDRYMQYGIPPQVAAVLATDAPSCRLFEESHTKQTARLVANLITTDFMGVADTREKRAASCLRAEHLTALAGAVSNSVITRSQAKTILARLARDGGDAAAMIREAASSEDLAGVVDSVIREEPDAAERARTNPPAVNYLVGMVMKKTRGSADPQETLRLIRKSLGL